MAGGLRLACAALACRSSVVEYCGYAAIRPRFAPALYADDGQVVEGWPEEWKS